jgi:hypothetical protein
MLILCTRCDRQVSGSGQGILGVLQDKLADVASVTVLCLECTADFDFKADDSRLGKIEQVVQALLQEFGQLRTELGKGGGSGPVVEPVVEKSYASVLKTHLPKLIQRAADSAFLKAERAASDLGNRQRTVVIDGLPEAANADADRRNVTALLGELGVPSGPLNVRRVGLAQAGTGQPRKPRKVKVQLASQDHQRHLTSPPIRRCLRTPEWEGRRPGIFVNPARTKEERRRLWLLRRRRDDLNRAAEEEKAADSSLPNKHWMLDSRRAVIILRVNGAVDRSVRDRPIAEWAADYGGGGGGLPRGGAGEGAVGSGQGAVV